MSRALSESRAAIFEIVNAAAAFNIPIGGDTDSLQPFVREPIVEFGIGDIVSRDGTDEHVVTGVNEAGDLIDVKCVKRPTDGWIEVGETESNLTRRYTLVMRDVKNVDAGEAR